MEDGLCQIPNIIPGMSASILTCDCSIQGAEMKYSQRVLQNKTIIPNSNTQSFTVLFHLFYRNTWGEGGVTLNVKHNPSIDRKSWFSTAIYICKKKKIKEENISQVKIWYWSSKAWDDQKLKYYSKYKYEEVWPIMNEETR